MSRRWKWTARALAILAMPPVLWVLLIPLVPTGWARDRIAARLSAASGRRATVDSVRFGRTGQATLAGIRIYDPGRPDDPFLHVENLALDLNLGHLLCGRFDPAQVVAEGVSLRVRRRANGAFDLADLFQPRPAHVREQAASAPACRVETNVSVALKRGRVVLIDEPTGTKLDLDGIEAHATWLPDLATIDDLRGTLNGGPLALRAKLDRTRDVPRFEGEASARDVALSSKMELLSYFMPILAGARAELGGTLGFDLEIRGQGNRAEALAETLSGAGVIQVDDIDLQGSLIVNELARLIRHPEDNHVGSLSSDFMIGQRRITSREMVLNLGRVPIRLAGYTDFDGQLDYRIQSEDIAGRAAPEARQILADLPIKLDSLVTMHLKGTTRKVKLVADTKAAPGSPEAEERVKLERLGRRLLERIRR
ncbi:MAG: AsmA-like C-terminal region-containing protein [Isosphaeraceae bacterium]